MAFVTAMQYRAVGWKFSLKWRKKVSPNIPCQIYYCGIIPLQNIKLCRLHDLLSSILIHMSLQLSLHLKSNDGDDLGEQVFSSELGWQHRANKLQGKETLVGVSSYLSHEITRKGGTWFQSGSASCLLQSTGLAQTEGDKPAANKRNPHISTQEW